MNSPSPRLDPSRITKLAIQSWRRVKNDMKRNWKWIVLFIGAIFLYTAISACIARQLDGGFIATKPSGTGVAQSVTTLLDWSEAFYFTVINMTTVGFGDIIPLTPAARALAILNSVFGLIVFAGLVSVITIAFAPSGSDTGVDSGSVSAPAAGPGSDPPGHQEHGGREAPLNDLVWLPDYTRLLRQHINVILQLDETEFPPDQPVEDNNARAEKLRSGLLELTSSAELLEELVYRHNRLYAEIRKRVATDDPKPAWRNTGRSKV